jgi:hypothetical protein
MQDVAADAQRLLSELLAPQPAACFLTLSTGRKRPPRHSLTYILGEDDHATQRPGTEFASRLGVEPVMAPGSHNGLLTYPEAVASAILAA